ncbi:hypothetical protein GUJ93_ZPchr0012g19428 [Zizania palustris]|uniref:Uncharacterized protein n=1 Tax=Zizania palustris TaxID=103762 RepID=A0A8J6BX71_ZIZPA|nr:hypothetical protein GUJ93_ZPchr0012g19428 [Zizania palustris]
MDEVAGKGAVSYRHSDARLGFPPLCPHIVPFSPSLPSAARSACYGCATSTDRAERRRQGWALGPRLGIHHGCAGGAQEQWPGSGVRRGVYEEARL